MIRIALLDDHPAVVAGLRRLIEADGELEVAASASTTTDLAHALAGVRADVLVLDHDPSRLDGLSHCRRVKERPDAPGVVIYSAYAGPATVLAARAAQADAVVDKADDVQVLLAAIRAVAAGGTMLPAVPRDAFEAAVARLEDDDLPVFAMLLDHESLDAIAQTLGVRRDEIAWRAQRIVGRLRPRLRSQAGLEGGLRGTT